MNIKKKKTAHQKPVEHPVVPAEAAAAPKSLIASGQKASGRGLAFAVVFGLFLGLLLLKFSNPPIMEKLVSPPEDFVELIFGHSWPLKWGYWLLAAVAFLGVFSWKWHPKAPLVLAWLPLGWFTWQLFAAARTVDGELTAATVPHLAACVMSFYLGLYALGRVQRSQAVWFGIVAALVLVIMTGWHQHFGGLEETRKYFWVYVYPNLKVVPVDYMKKINSDRIFATLFYPNTLAAAMILLLPAATATIYRWAGGGRFTPAARWFLALGFASTGLACLVWSGSKGGWLVMLFVVVLGFLLWPSAPEAHAGRQGAARWLRITRRTKLATVIVLIVAGLGGFFYTYSGFFKRGAPSVGARFDYWRGAVQTALSRPIHGSGPGTFAVPYREIKAEDAEMARLAHNDYLQQASDSGFPGFILYTAFIGSALWVAGRKIRPSGWQDADRLVRFAAFLGLCGWAAHSLLEFNLYIPAVSWTAFAILGWLCAEQETTEEPGKINHGPQTDKSVAPA